MAKCSKCGLDKPESEFNFNKTKGRIEYHCKQCHSNYLKEHYAKNKAYYKDKANKRQQKTREWFKEYKNGLKCEKCNQNHPACMEFHHIESSLKEIDMSDVACSGWSIKRILKEIEKCVVLCSNCHRIHHWETKTGSWRHRK